MIEITNLYIYPVKSLRGIALSEAVTSQRGFKYDREWMITDSDYFFLTQRQIEKMATITVQIDANYLTLRSPKGGQVKVSLNNSHQKFVKATVWDDVCSANDEGDEVSDWLTQTLGRYNNKLLRLVRFAASEERQVPSKYLTEGEAQSAFSDQFPYLITSWNSLDILNSALTSIGQTHVEMNRFRPNIVVNGISDIENKQPHNLYSTNKEYFFGLRKACKRCKITTISQDTGEIINIKEPLATLTNLAFNQHTSGAFFGQNAVCSSQKSILVRVGDTFYL